MTSDPLNLGEPLRELAAISAQDSALVFPSFTADIAWTLGTLLRARLIDQPLPVVISISLSNNDHLLFHTVTKSGAMPDNDVWVRRKRKTVLRFGHSSWYMHNKFQGDEAAFAAKYALGSDAGQYAIHGGGWPIRVKGVEGVVGVVVVSGMKQHQDHQVIVSTVEELLRQMGADILELEKRKED